MLWLLIHGLNERLRRSFTVPGLGAGTKSEWRGLARAPDLPRLPRTSWVNDEAEAQTFPTKQACRPARWSTSAKKSENVTITVYEYGEGQFQERSVARPEDVALTAEPTVAGSTSGVFIR